MGRDVISANVVVRHAWTVDDAKTHINLS